MFQLLPSLQILVPRIVHQIWLQGEHKSPIPVTELQNLPWGNAVKHEFWDEQRITHLVETQYSAYASWFSRIPMLMIKVDVARGFLLHHFGGVYVDIDYHPTHRFEEVFDIPLLKPAVGEYQDLGLTRIPNNAWIASRKGDIFWTDVFFPDVYRQLANPSLASIVFELAVGSWATVLFAAGPLAWWSWVKRGDAIAFEFSKVYQSWGEHAKRAGTKSGWVRWAELGKHVAVFAILLFFSLYGVVKAMLTIQLTESN